MSLINEYLKSVDMCSTIPHYVSGRNIINKIMTDNIMIDIDGDWYFGYFEIFKSLETKTDVIHEYLHQRYTEN